MLSKIRPFLLLLVVIIYLVTALTKKPELNNLLSLIVLVNILLAFSYVKRANKIIALAMLTISISIFVSQDKWIMNTLLAFSKNAGLLAMLLTIPLLGVPLSFGGYHQELSKIYDRYLKREHVFYLFTSFFAHFVGLFTNLATVPITIQMSESRRKCYQTRTISNAVIRGFSANPFWSPSSVAVVFVLERINRTWVEIVPIGILLSIIMVFYGFAVHVLDNFLYSKEELMKVDYSVNKESIKWEKIIELFTVLFLFMGVLYLLITVAGWDNMTAIVVLSIVSPIFWSCYLRKMENFHHEIINYLQNRMLSSTNEFVLFGCVGVFSVALGKVDISQQINCFFNLFGNNLMIIKLGIFYCLWLLSIIGIIPLLTLTTLASILSPELLNVSPFYFAYLLLGAYGMGFAGTPFSACSMLMASLINRSSWETGLKWNIIYVLLFPPVLLFVLDFLNI